MLLDVKDIKVFYGRAAALQGISLEIEEDGIIALLGANGAGKTTTLRAISGLKPIASGEIWFRGRRIDGMPPHKIAGLGVAHVPEGKRLFTDMTVLENLKMGAYLRQDTEVDRDLERIYRHFPILEERRQQRSGSLSGGEQQMLAIGRALMSQPKVLLLDEPSIGLSPLMVQEIAKVIMDLRQGGSLGIILVEQNARMAFRLVKKAYVLQTGSVVLAGDTEELMQNEEVRKAYLGE